MYVEVEVSAAKVPTGRGGFTDGVCLTCTRCGKEVKVAGTTIRSRRRGYIMLREDCDKGEENFYKADDDDSADT